MTARKTNPVAYSKGWMLGPKAENEVIFERLLVETLRDCCYWRKNFHPEDEPFISHEDRRDSGFQEQQERLQDEMNLLMSRLRSGVPFFSPRYVGHMLTDQFMAGFLGYAAATFHNQNTLAQELAPVTLEFEGEAMQQIGVMLGLDPTKAWGHLCAGGTPANIESLWVARNVRLFPYLLKKAIAESGNQVASFLRAIRIGTEETAKSFGDCITNPIHKITIDEIIGLHANLKTALQRQSSDTPDTRSLKLAAAEQIQKWSPARVGLARCIQELGNDGPRFRMVIGKNAHYSLIKAAGLLGLGESDVIKIESIYDENLSDERVPMRMDMDALNAALDGCDRNNECVLAVVGVYGTTEISAIDPFDHLVKMRETRRTEEKGDFWIHADACYGGYAASMLRSGDGNAIPLSDYLVELATKTGYSNTDTQNRANLLESRIVAHTEALSKCDSISIDPHKLGYIPYPAGAILFRHRDVRELIKYEAPYLNAADQNSSKESAPKAAQSHELQMLPEELGSVKQDETVKDRIPWYEGEMSSYTLEGSRPGASAAAVYLAHRTIPLTQEGHGAVVGQTLLGTWKLSEALRSKIKLVTDKESFGVSFLNPEPDLNIVCYTFPGQYKLPGMTAMLTLPLYVVNEIVRRLYQEYLPTSVHPMPTRDFVIAKTALPFEKYGDHLSQIWGRLNRQVGIESPIGRFASRQDLASTGNPWRDDSEIVLVRTAIMGIFFLTARTTHLGKTIDLSEHYASTINDSIFKIAGEVLDSPLPPERRPKLTSPVIIVEDDPREMAALKDQFTSEKSIHFQPKDGDLGDAGNRQDAVSIARRIRAKGALVDVALGDDRIGGVEFLKTILAEPWFHGAVLFTSSDIDQSGELRDLQEAFQNASKKLYFHRKPSINSRHYQAKVNLVLADLWDILQ